MQPRALAAEGSSSDPLRRETRSDALTTYAMEKTERLTLDAHPRLAGMYVLNPIVWKAAPDHHLLLRAGPMRDEEPRLKMAKVF